MTDRATKSERLGCAAAAVVAMADAAPGGPSKAGFDPLLLTPVRLFAQQIQQLPHYPHKKGFGWSLCRASRRADVFLFRGHPVTRVEVLGLVTAVDVRPKLTTVALDDGTGSVACVRWAQPLAHPDADTDADADPDAGRHCPALGSVLLVRGRLSSFDEASQIIVSNLYCVHSVPQEIYWISQTIFLNKFVYPKIGTIRTGMGTPAGRTQCPVWARVEARLPAVFGAPDVQLVEGSVSAGEAADLVAQWVALGLIGVGPDHGCRRLPSAHIDGAVLLSLASKQSSSVHFRFVWNSLRTDGYRVSEQAVLQALGRLARSSGRVVQTSHHMFRLLPSSLIEQRNKSS